MGFFDDIEVEPEELPEPRANRSLATLRRDVLLPASLPWERVLARTPAVCTALRSVACWPAHLTLEIAVYSLQKPAYDTEFVPIPGGAFTARAATRPGCLRIAAVFADGRYATTVRGSGLSRPYTKGLSVDYPIFTPWGGGGGGGREHQSGTERWFFSQHLDLWPLPPPGPFTLVVDWLDKDIPETSHTWEAEAILEASRRAVRIWE
jgi:hypothetical protein